MERTLYYIDAWTDETMPCTPTLEGWAAWLAKPDPTWGREAPAKDGEEFEASTMIELEDLIATRTATGWDHPSVDARAEFFAERYGPGLGWEVESCADTLTVFLGSYPEHQAAEIGDQIRIACCMNGPDYRLRFDLSAQGPCLRIVSQTGRA